jgi:hypothetical protein
MKRSSILLGVTVSLLSFGAFAAPKENPAPMAKPAATETAKKAKKPAKPTDTQKPKANRATN